MAGNSIGNLFRLTTYGESHGGAIGGIVEGCPSGLELSIQHIQNELDRRRPGQSSITSPRKESDKVILHSGIFEGKTLGTPIGFTIPNNDPKSEDYGQVKEVFRPGHADYTWEQKFGFRDYRGGGRSSARETASRVVGGAIAKQLLKQTGVEVYSYVSSVGVVAISDNDAIDLNSIDSNSVRCPNSQLADAMQTEIENARNKGDTLGGIISVMVKNVPVGWGEPVFDKLNAEIGKAVLSINAVKGIEFGKGFDAARMFGSEMNDEFVRGDHGIETKTNHSGGIQGGISNGQDITFRVAFKPVSTIFKKQQTVDKNGEPTELSMKGRHDPCVLPRAVPIVDAMTALVLADHYLLSKSNKL